MTSLFKEKVHVLDAKTNKNWSVEFKSFITVNRDNVFNSIISIKIDINRNLSYNITMDHIVSV